MMPIRLSDKLANGLRLVSNLPEEALTKICESDVALRGGNALAEGTQFRELIAASTGLGGEDLMNVAGAIGAVFFYHVQSCNSEAELLSDLSSALPEYEFDAVAIENLETRIRSLLSMPKLYSAFKATALARENERLLGESKILTDIRPVFGVSLDSGILGYMVSHTLKMSYVDARGDGEFFVTLDEEDLNKLKETVDRAIRKQLLLREASGLSIDA